MDKTDISLIIATRNRAATLQPALDSLLRLRTTHSAEIVIVDNGSTDGTPALLSAFAEESRLPVQLITFPKPGLGRARNAGWRRARGRVLAFTDDDCYPDSAYLDKAVLAFADPRTGYVGGRIMLHDPLDLRITIREDMQPQFLPAHSVVDAGVIQGANMIVLRDAIAAVGGFDDNLGAGTPFPCEDIDLIQRLSTAGWNGAYDPVPFVEHHHRRRGSEALRAVLRSYDLGRGAHYAKCLRVPELRVPILLKWAKTALTTSPRRFITELHAARHYLQMRSAGLLDPSPTNHQD